MVLVLGILVALLVLAVPVAYVLGVLTDRLARAKMRREIEDLTKQLARQDSQKPTHTVSYGIGVPLGILLQHRPEINALREQVVEHWREQSQPDDELIH